MCAAPTDPQRLEHDAGARWPHAGPVALDQVCVAQGVVHVRLHLELGQQLGAGLLRGRGQWGVHEKVRKELPFQSCNLSATAWKSAQDWAPAWAGAWGLHEKEHK